MTVKEGGKGVSWPISESENLMRAHMTISQNSVKGANMKFNDFTESSKTKFIELCTDDPSMTREQVEIAQSRTISAINSKRTEMMREIKSYEGKCKRIYINIKHCLFSYFFANQKTRAFRGYKR